MRRYVSHSIIFIVGVVCGMAATTWFWSGMRPGEIFTLFYLGFESDEATRQYKAGSNDDVSIYALEHQIRFNEDFVGRWLNPETGSSQRLMEKLRPLDLVVSYVRLGKLYQKKGFNDKGRMLYERALDLASSRGLFKEREGTEKAIRTVEDLRDFVDKMDEALMAEQRIK